MFGWEVALRERRNWLLTQGKKRVGESVDWIEDVLGMLTIDGGMWGDVVLHYKKGQEGHIVLSGSRSLIDIMRDRLAEIREDYEQTSEEFNRGKASGMAEAISILENPYAWLADDERTHWDRVAHSVEEGSDWPRECIGRMEEGKGAPPIELEEDEFDELDFG